MQETMFTYMQKEQSTDQAILLHHAEYLAPFYEWLKHHRKSRWVILATGSSANAIEAAKYYVEKIAQVHVDIRIPFLFCNYEQQFEDNEVYIAVSQSGHSFSTMQALQTIPSEDSFVLTADVHSPIAKNTANVLTIGCGFEAVDLVTMGFSATVLDFMLMGLQAAYTWGIITGEAYLQELAELKQTVSRIDDTIEKCEAWYGYNHESFLDMKEVAVIGYGAGYGVAKEAETKITETIHCPMHGYELEEYMHGPYLAMHKDLTVFFIMSEHAQCKERMNALYRYISKVTPNCYRLGERMTNTGKDLDIGQPVDEYKSALLYVIAFQYLSYRVCHDLGVDPMITPYDDFDQVLASKV